MSLALYREFRPKTFDEVVGQNHITKTLKNQVKTGNITHAYLFTGARGTGKTSTAKIFSKAINCLSPVDGSPCGKCSVCQALNGVNTDVMEIDAASNNRVDEIRDLREMVKYPPVIGKKKVYIIDEVHMLTESAFNALLKTLEEPPEYVVFILATTEVHKIPATILSRCTRFDFRLLSVDELKNVLRSVLNARKIKYDEESLHIIASQGEGSVRDTLSIADSVLSYSEDNISIDKTLEVLGLSSIKSVTEIVKAVGRSDTKNLFIAIKNSLMSGKNISVLCKEMTEYFKNLILLKDGIDDYEILNIMPTDIPDYKSVVDLFDRAKLKLAFEKLSRIELDLKFSLNPVNLLEAVLISLMGEVSPQPYPPKTNVTQSSQTQNYAGPQQALNSTQQPMPNQNLTQPNSNVNPQSIVNQGANVQNTASTNITNNNNLANNSLNDTNNVNNSINNVDNNLNNSSNNVNLNNSTNNSENFNDTMAPSSSNNETLNSTTGNANGNAESDWGRVLIEVKNRNLFAFSATIKNIYGVESEGDNLILHTNDKSVLETIDTADKKELILNILHEFTNKYNNVKIIYDENNKSKDDIIKSLKETFMDKLKVKE